MTPFISWNFSCLLSEVFLLFLLFLKQKACLSFHDSLRFALQDWVTLGVSDSTGFIWEAQALIYLFHLFLQHAHYPGILSTYKWSAWDWQTKTGDGWRVSKQSKSIRHKDPSLPEMLG